MEVAHIDIGTWRRHARNFASHPVELREMAQRERANHQVERCRGEGNTLAIGSHQVIVMAKLIARGCQHGLGDINSRTERDSLA